MHALHQTISIISVKQVLLAKKSMSLESKNAVKNLDDVREIREAMKESDRHLRDLWRTARKMIVEDNIR